MKIGHIFYLAAAAALGQAGLPSLPWWGRPRERVIQSVFVPLVGYMDKFLGKQHDWRVDKFRSSLMFNYIKVSGNYRVYVCESAYETDVEFYVGDNSDLRRGLLYRMALLYTKDKNQLVELLNDYRYDGNLRTCKGTKPLNAVRLCKPSECAQDSDEERKFTAYVVYREDEVL